MMFDGGLFILLNILGIVFLLKGNLTFRIVALIIFFALGTILIAGYDVGFVWTGTEAVSTGSAATTVEVTQTVYLIGDADPATFNDNATWVGWIYITLGALTSFMFLGRYIGLGVAD